MALPTKHRLKNKKEFDAVKKKGRLVSGPFFSVLVFRDKTGEPAKFGFVVSKRIDKRAVVRNKIRRLLSTVVMEIAAKTPAGLKIVFLAKHSIKEAELAELKQSLKTLAENLR